MRIRDRSIPADNFVWSAVVVLAAAMIIVIQFGAGPRADRAADDALHDHMEQISDNLKQVLRNVGPEQKSTALQHLSDVQKHIVEAKQLGPPALDRQPESGRDAFRLEFRRALAELLIETGKLEIEIIDAKSDDATKRIRETIIAMRDAAHEKFQVIE